MALRYLDDSNYTLGIIRDVPSWRIPPGGVYDSLNLISDQPGILRMRNGTTVLQLTNQAAMATMIGWVRSDDATQIEELYGLNGKTGALSLISKSSGLATSLGTPAPTGIVGKPARHFGFLVFPIAASPQVTHGAVSVAGITTNTSFTSTAIASVTAGTPRIQVSAPDTTGSITVGAVVSFLFLDGASTQWQYWGRVVGIDSGTLFRVWPTPTVTGSGGAGNLIVGPSRASSAGGACAASFQNRLLIGNSMDLSAPVGVPVRNDRRVIYSILPTESSGGNIGATFVDSGSWPRLNYFDVPGSDPILGMEPVSDNQLLILTSSRPFVFSGNLVTQTVTTSPTITFDISEVPGNGTCISGLGVQNTAKGVVWAGYGGIYAWNGREPIDLTDKKINAFWRGKVLGSSFALHGSAYVRGHYVVSYTSGGVTEALAVNLANLAWTRLSGAGTDMFTGAPRPTNPASVWAARWWDQAGAAPTFTNQQTVKLEPMFDPYTVTLPVQAAKDSDGNPIAWSVTPRVLVGDSETQKIQQRATVRYRADQLNTATVTVTAQTKLDAADVSADSVRTLGTLSSTGVRTVLTASNANPIVITSVQASHGLQTDDFVDIDGVLGNLNANGRWRVLVTGAQTFSLVGGIGSGAYTSGGSFKKVNEQDFTTSSLDAGQGISLLISSTGTGVGTFEFHGWRAALLEKPPVMSS